MLLRVALSLVYIWYKDRSYDFPRPDTSANNSAIANNNNTNNNNTNNNSSNNNNSSRFLLFKSFSRTKASSNLPPNNNQIDDNIAQINEQIINIIQNCPIAIQTILNMGWAIRNFKHSSFENRQRDFENKFRNKVAQIRSEKTVSRPFRTVYTAPFSSKIIDNETASEIMCALPSRFQLETPELLFRLSENGASFVQFWTK